MQKVWFLQKFHLLQWNFFHLGKNSESYCYSSLQKSRSVKHLHIENRKHFSQNVFLKKCQYFFGSSIKATTVLTSSTLFKKWRNNSKTIGFPPCTSAWRFKILIQVMFFFINTYFFLNDDLPISLSINYFFFHFPKKGL